MNFLTGIWTKIAGAVAFIVFLLGSVIVYGWRERKQARDDLRQEDREKISEAERIKYEMDKTNRSRDAESLRDRLRKQSNKL